MEWYFIFLVLLASMIVLMTLGLPISASLGIVAFTGLVVGVGIDQGLEVLATEFTKLWGSYTLVAIPLFILMGEFLFVGGVVGSIFNMASKWVGRLPGGMSLAVIVACALFATVTGTSLGATATIGRLTIPLMLKKGYDKRLACGAVAAAGGLAHLIPPSILLIIYASIAEVSVARVLMAGFLPGLVLGSGYAIVAALWSLKAGATPKEPPVSWGERFRSTRGVIWPVLLVIVILGSLYAGIATVTESASFGALAALIIAISSKRLSLSEFKRVILQTARITSFIMFIAVGGKLFSWVLTFYLIPQSIVTAIVGTGLDPWQVMVLLQLMFIVFGMFIDPVGMVIIMVPIALPLILSFGYDPIWFGILLMINIEMATITPPLGLHLYVVQGVAPKEVTVSHVLVGALTFMSADLLTLALVMIFPQIALWLPSQMS